MADANDGTRLVFDDSGNPDCYPVARPGEGPTVKPRPDEVLVHFDEEGDPAVVYNMAEVSAEDLGYWAKHDCETEVYVSQPRHEREMAELRARERSEHGTTLVTFAVASTLQAAIILYLATRG